MDLNKDGRVDEKEACIAKLGRAYCITHADMDDGLDYRFDLNLDGMFTLEEYDLSNRWPYGRKAVMEFEWLDANSDGLLTPEEKSAQEEKLARTYYNWDVAGGDSKDLSKNLSRAEADKANKDWDEVDLLFHADINDDDSLSWVEYCMYSVNSVWKCDRKAGDFLVWDSNGDLMIDEKEMDVLCE
jgi:hypothetical protein